MEHAFSLTEVESLDAKSFVPLYIQLADKLSALIERHGGAAVGKALPSEAECVQHFSISRPTVRQAMDHLGRLGLLVREKGRGTFVAPRLNHDMSHGFEHEMAAARRNVRLELLAWLQMPPPEAAREALQLDEREEVRFLRRLRIVDDIAVGVEERYFPSPLGDRITEHDARTAPMLVLLRKVTGERCAQLKIEVTSGIAGKALAPLLQVKPVASVLSKRLTYLINGKPLAYGSTTFLSEHYQFRFSVNLPM